jgi:hypothetical protein
MKQQILILLLLFSLSANATVRQSIEKSREQGFKYIVETNPDPVRPYIVVHWEEIFIPSFGIAFNVHDDLFRSKKGLNVFRTDSGRNDTESETVEVPSSFIKRAFSFLDAKDRLHVYRDKISHLFEKFEHVDL